MTRFLKHNLLIRLSLTGMALVFALMFLLSQPLSASAASRVEMAFVRVIHASPDAGKVDVFVDGTKLLDNFAFGTVTDYVAVAGGSHKIQVSPTGKGADAAVITQSVSVESGMSYTVAALGTTASGFSLQAFGDNNMLANGQAKVRVYHLSPDAGPVNIAAGGSTVITGLSYQKASGYLTVPAGSYTFDVTATDANAKVPVNATLAINTVNSVFAIGLLKGTPALKFVAATVKGLPQMPGTGSDPNAPLQPVNNPALPWFLGAGILLILAGGLSARRLFTASQR